MSARILSEIKNILLTRGVILIVMMAFVSACQPVTPKLRPPNLNEIKAFTADKGITLVVDKLLGDSSVLLYESSTSIGYYILSVREPEGTLVANHAFKGKNDQPISILEQLSGDQPFLAVVIQDPALRAETVAVDVFIADENYLGDTTDGKAGVVIISHAHSQIRDWKSFTLYNAQGKILFKQERYALQQLRIENHGKVDIHDLKVLFPGKTANAEATRIGFGDLPAGEMSDYQEIPGGVYRYAAYEYTLDGRVVNQAVMDWVGESPLQGEKFTYRITLDPTKMPGNQMQLIEVLTDKP